MASRIMHGAVAFEIARNYPIRNFERFLLGELLPDAYAENRGTFDSHLKISVCGGLAKTYDLETFRAMFMSELKEDDLYRGYYLHLVQDLCFRNLIYTGYHWNPLIPGNVARLHRDYALLNADVIERYRLENRLEIPDDFQKEPINRLYPFGIERLQKEFSSDFALETAGESFFFTKEMAEEFIETACVHSVKELQALDRGEVYTDMHAMAWKR